MPQPDADRLKAIKSLPQLVAYLRDELDWPIQSEEPEEIVFDYTPEDLGLNPQAAVKIKEIKQLRPLAGSQPWGIFFVNFEKKQLPVSVMRLILRALVFKKRASANKADRQAWQPHDLLFVSSCGTDNNRSISFAHFVENKETELSELRVLGWDDDDTPLHMDYVSRMLHEKLGWDARLASNPEEWRTRWSEAFLLKHRHTITKADELAEALAGLATKLRNRLRTLLKYEDGHGEIRRLQRAFELGLIHDLNDESFADMFAQTVTYGLFSVSVRRTFPGEGTAVTKDDPANLIFTSPFLKEMLGVFLGLKSRKGKIDFDQLGISDVTDLLNSPDTHMDVVLADFNNKTRGEDPVIHFYEHFLSSYNKKLKVERGVFYTPQPVVSYIVRSVHELLQTEFGLADGLADTTTWGEMLKKHPGLKLPPLTDEPDEKRTISPDEPFVQILDPATGTATFLVEVIDVIHKTLSEKWGKEGLSKNNQNEAWNDYVPKHLLTRLHAFELMMAPYAIAHMKIGLKLAETGYRFGTEERARIYLTNALEPWVKQPPLIGFDALAHEAEEVNKIKRHKRFTVVIGNPPYGIKSGNLSPGARAIIDRYRICDQGLIRERGALQFEKNLQNDYVKFVRYAELCIAASTRGIIGLITSHAFLSNRTLRGMRESLSETFQYMSYLNLHGNSASGEAAVLTQEDKNVFDITEGVCINLLLSTPKTSEANACYADLAGTREFKYSWLRSHSCSKTKWVSFQVSRPHLIFKPSDGSQIMFEKGISLEKIFPQRSAGVITARDDFATDMNKEALISRVEAFAASSLSGVRLCAAFNIKEKNGWDVNVAKCQARDEMPLRKHVHRYFYRPFDARHIAYNRGIVWGMAYPTLKHTLGGQNLVLVGMQQYQYDVPEYCYAFVTRGLTDSRIFVSKTGVATLFPLYLRPSVSELQIDQCQDVNMSRTFIDSFIKATKLKWITEGKGDLKVGGNLGPESIFSFVYAQLNAPEYRIRFADPLRTSFPRVFLPNNLELFRKLAQLGSELIALHLLESTKLAQSITKFIGSSHPVVEKISWSRNTVWVDKEQTTGFEGIPENVWNFHVGGYQVCEKWLKDRKGGKLLKEEIAHYQKIIVALSESIRLMKEIDEVIEKHGGWPGAFSASKETETEVQERAEAEKDEPPPIQQSFL
jgi:hypothetical protein